MTRPISARTGARLLARTLLLMALVAAAVQGCHHKGRRGPYLRPAPVLER
jgi:hypothetical protein